MNNNQPHASAGSHNGIQVSVKLIISFVRGVTDTNNFKLASPENNVHMREIIKRIGALLKIFAPLSDPPSEKVHRLKNWSPPGIEPGSMAWNAIALTIRP